MSLFTVWAGWKAILARVHKFDSKIDEGKRRLRPFSRQKLRQANEEGGLKNIPPVGPRLVCPLTYGRMKTGARRPKQMMGRNTHISYNVLCKYGYLYELSDKIILTTSSDVGSPLRCCGVMTLDVGPGEDLCRLHTLFTILKFIAA